MSNIGFFAIIGSDIEVMFCSPYCCVCGVTFSSKRDLGRHILGDDDAGRHPCPTIESILRQEWKQQSPAPSVAPSLESLGPFGPPASSAATASSAASPLFDSSDTFALSALPASSTPPRQYTGSISIHYVELAELGYAGPISSSCVYDKSFGGYGYGVAR
ncbi:hypothetical protein K457DRAFT_13407 [Linnemannia elongata AG-77]|uniref:Uncharacterized protein n=1 Tax=Linnemannia elongata AG-77 TaxID=1314771 RepID=A0A197KGJ3_9FUNG|nr:hypothetical protein K457DRAFT_13407 [Linnemannia elongata AG-77]